jgi:tetratricopeptide (TPR) repeat protein
LGSILIPALRTTRAGRLAASLVAVLAVLAPGGAYAQRQPFIDHLITVRSLLFGTYGDEADRILAEIDRLSGALAEWDASLLVQERTLRTSSPAAPRAARAEERSALAALLVNRGRLGAALLEVEVALALNPGRRQLHSLRGRLLDAFGHQTDAAVAYRRAWDLDRDDAVSAYLALSLGSGSSTDAGPTPTRTLLEAQRRAASVSADRPGLRPIREVSLIPDQASKAPVFAPAAYADVFSAIAAGRYPVALAQLRAAAARDPLIVDPASRSTEMSLGIARLRAGLMAEAIAPLESAATLYPDSSEAHRILGAAYGTVGDSVQAVAHLQRAIVLSPRDERSRLALARAWRDSGRLDLAEQALRETLAVLPRSAESRWRLGEILERTGGGLNAAHELEAAASASVIAGRAALYWRAAQAYDRHQEFERVVALLRKRVLVDPNNPTFHRQLGLVQSRLGQRDEAFAELALADLLGGADAETLTTIGQIHLDADRLEDAEVAARRAIVMAPDHREARYVLGRTLLRQGRPADAREQLDAFQRLRARAMDDQRRTFEIDTLRAVAARESAAGQHDQAAATWLGIVERLPVAPDVRIAAAEALAASGQLEAAAMQFEKAASLGAGPDAQRRLAEVYAQLGRRLKSDQARRAYEQQVKSLLKVTPSARP